VSKLTIPARASAFVKRCRDAVSWRAYVLRQRSVKWQTDRKIRHVKRKARVVIDELARMKAANPGRPFCGILLIEHIGDIIACEPIIAQVREAHPNAFVVWVVKPQFAPLLTRHPNLNAVVCVDSFLSVEAIIDSRVFDHAVDLHVNSKPSGIPGRAYQKTSGDPGIDVDTYLSKGSLLRAFSLAAGIEPRAAAPTMFIPNESVTAIDARVLPETFVVVHAASNQDYKNWSPPKWRDLVRYIVDHYETHVIEIGLENVIDLEHSRFKTLCGTLSLMETAELIRRSAFFIGVDSGPAHMANAWRRPGLLLFSRFFGSDTFNPFEGLYAEHAETVILRYRGALQEQPVASVIAALEESPMWKETHGHLKRARL
jgi:heptosyltransferase-3